ncbi:5-(carboxyamino)imidazole ribonucleotide mutase [Candidatus Kinetoplastibacterium blastocrithidii (ex Strigomonas culicis)]|nr:5-(carboxyamino)imidazole ribonucleotide mutase [Candidatus Kinetoplastibacterium blastocrithidii (ex Strigomonas culicis)]
MPKEMFDYASEAHNRGLKAIIAGAGGAAHLPGMIAALTEVPVFGVPVPSKYLSGEDSLLSIVQMPKGIPVATFAIGEAGAVNAALHVLANMALFDNELRCKLLSFRESQTDKARNMKL